MQLSRLTVIIGANGSGKTNLIEAVAIAGAGAANKLDHEFLAARGIRTIEGGITVSRFRDLDPPVHVRITVGAPLGDWEYAVGGGRHSDFRFGYRAVAHGGEAFEDFRKRQASEGVREAETAWFERLPEGRPPGLSTFLVYAPEYAALRTFADEAQILPLGIRGEGLFKHLVDLSRRAPDVLVRIGEHLRVLDWFDGFVIPSDLGPGEKRLGIRDRYLSAEVHLDQRIANEGFLFLLFVYTLMESPDTHRFFAIDNADASLNPLLCARLVTDIARLAQAHDRQVILTTHNAGMLDGLDLADAEQRLLVCERDLDGHTRFRAVPPPTGSRVNLSEAFLRGYLGGLPKHF